MIEDQYKLATQRLKGRLFVPYQRDGVLWMLSMESQTNGPRGGFLSDEMGLGKTVQIISTLLGNPQERTLIVVPKSVISQWSEEICKFSDLKVEIYDGPNRKLKMNCDVVLAPYTVMGDIQLHGIRWDRIVLDEAHEIRNIQSKTFKNVIRLQGGIRWIVTGTPVFNSMKDFVSLACFLGFSKLQAQGMTQDIKDVYILRRTKEDLAKINERLRLPKCHFENVELDMYKEESQLYEVVFSEAQDTIREAFRHALSLNAKNMLIIECLLRARQCMIWPQMYLDGVAQKEGQVAEVWRHPTAKMDTLFKMLGEHSDEKSLIFCQFRGEMDYIQKRCTVPVFRIDGSLQKDERARQIQGFKKAPPGSVFIIQIKAGGQGLNIQEATRVYITAPAWNPATELQAIGRSHRTGQTKEVWVKKLVYKESPRFVSVEQEMMALQGHKSIICSQVLNDERIKDQIPVKKISDKISILDIKKIFKA